MRMAPGRLTNLVVMIKNYFRVALRNLKKNLSYVFINTIGLGIALACCVTAYLFLAYNFEFDSHLEDEQVKDVYSIYSHIRSPEGETYTTIGAPMVMMHHAVNEIPGITAYTRYLGQSGNLRYGNNIFSEYVNFADSTFFDMFRLRMKTGSPESFKQKSTVILNETTAKKYFGNDDPVGKILTAYFINDTQIDFMVGGVAEQLPPNTSFQFNILARIENFNDDIFKIAEDDWADWRHPSTFIAMPDEASARKLGSKLQSYGDQVSVLRPSIDIDSFSIHPFKEKYAWGSVEDNYINGPIEPAPIIVFVSMAVVILLIACFNLTNTTIALTGKRLKEIGVRKAIGAQRRQILSQFLFETLIIMFLSLAVGMLMVQVIAPAFTTMWDWPFALSELNGVNLVITLILIVCFAALLAGIYPALFNSRFNPVSLIRGTVKVKGTNFLTRALVTMQFALCVIVLIGGFTFIRNAGYQENIDFGYNKDNIINVRIQGNRDFEILEGALRSNPQIEEVSPTDLSIGLGSYMAPATINSIEYETRVVQVGKNYFETIGLNLVEGRFLNLENANDRNEGIVVNRAFLKKTGIDDDPLDQLVYVNKTNRRITGVVEDHLDNLGSDGSQGPFVYIPADPNNYHTIVVRTTPGNRESVLKFLEQTWKELIPTRPFESMSQEDALLGNARQVNGNLKKIFLFLTVLGGLLSVSGIFSLASLNIARRTKEIGIRKALGATVQSILLLLNREFFVIMTIAGAVGAAGGFFLTRMLLDEIYSIHIALSWMPVLLCAFVVFVIGILTTSTTIRKAAKTNPVKTLRSE